MAGYDSGAPPLVDPCWVWMRKPLPVTLMHCWALLPQRLFMTTYRPPIVVDPYWSQISVSACAAGAPARGTARPAAASASAERACLSFIVPSPLRCGQRSGSALSVPRSDVTTVKARGKGSGRDQFSGFAVRRLPRGRVEWFHSGTGSVPRPAATGLRPRTTIGDDDEETVHAGAKVSPGLDIAGRGRAHGGGRGRARGRRGLRAAAQR